VSRSIIPFPVTTRALVFGGDWACAHGDTEALAFVATQLSERFSAPLGLELRELARLCIRDEDLASRRWPALRDRLSAT
jgi:hypothetical protein